MKKIKKEIDLFTQKQLILKNTYLHKKNNNNCENTIDYECLEFEEKNPTYTATSSDDQKICILTPIDPAKLPQKCKGKIKRNFYYYCKKLDKDKCDQNLLSNYKNRHSCLLIEQQQEAK